MMFANIAGGEVLSEHYLIKNKPFPGAMPLHLMSGILAVIPSLRSRAGSERSEGSLRPASQTQSSRSG